MKGNNPKVSVIVPVYNVEKYLARCLNSIIHQTLEDIEVIVVNDGSKDNSLDIIKEFVDMDSRVRLIDKPNSGYGNSMNRGLDAAVGEYIGIVESDDFIAADMYESLYALTLGGEVDVVKGNFYDYYEQEDSAPLIIANNARDMIPESDKPFTLKDYPELSEGHPSVWSAIYRTEFIRSHNIRFMEVKGAGWVDNPFFYETLCKAKSIMWTKRAFYFYYKSNPTSSSNLQLDCSLPFIRMLDNMDVVEDNCTDQGIMHSTNLRAFMYLRGALVDFDYGACDKQLTEYAMKVMRRLNPDTVRRYANADDKLLYYTYGSPLKNIRSKLDKILILGSVPFDNPWNVGGEKTRYCKMLISQILNYYPMENIYFLSSGWAYDATIDKMSLKKIPCVFDGRVHQYEVVNSPVPVDENNRIFNPEILKNGGEMKALIAKFIEERGPFKAVHFNGIDGFTPDVLELKKEFPETRFVYAMHGLNDVYPYRHLTELSEDEDFDDGISVQNIIYSKGRYNKDAGKCYSKKLWLKKLGLSGLTTSVNSAQADRLIKENIARINSGCDDVIALSEHIRSAAVNGGILKEKIRVIYNSVPRDNSRFRKEPPEAGEGISVVVFFDEENSDSELIIQTLSKMPLKYAAMIDITAVTPMEECAELRYAFADYKSLTSITGYSDGDIEDIFDKADIFIDPAPSDEKLSDITLKAVSHGKPVISCSSSAASELCSNDKFRYELNDMAQLNSRLMHFVDVPKELEEYWENSVPLTDAAEHAKGMLKIYGLNEDKSITISYEDFKWLEAENIFLQNSFSANKDTVSQKELNRLRDKLSKAREENERLKTEKEQMEQLHGKITFQADQEHMVGQMGVDLFSITLEEFDYNDFYAEIKFVKLQNLAEAVSDTLKISGTLYNNAIQFHQHDWADPAKPLDKWINVRTEENKVIFFAKYNGRACGYDYNIVTLTGRADHNSAEVKKINVGFIDNLELAPDGAACYKPETGQNGGAKAEQAPTAKRSFFAHGKGTDKR